MKHLDNKVHPSCGAVQWPLVMAARLRTLSVAEQDAMIERVLEKPRRQRRRRRLKPGCDAPDVRDALGVFQATIVPDAVVNAIPARAR